jgi:chemotaxis signal transduction protein
MVKFEYQNLAEDVFPSPLNNTNAMDIIFCRNVLMYFTQNRVKQVVRGLYNSLVKEGYLVVSASELSLQYFSEFAAVNFPGMVLYKKTSKKTKIQQAAPVIYDEPKPIIFQLPLQPINTIEVAEFVVRKIENEILPEIEKPVHINSTYEEALSFYSQGSYADVIDKLQKEDQTPEEQILLIRAYANQGKLSGALKSCEKAISADKLDPKLYYLYATILQENNQLNEAVASLKRAIYLDSNFVLSYYSLGNIYQLLGNYGNPNKSVFMKKTRTESEQPDKAKIDWNEIRSRVNSLQESLDHKIILLPEEKRSILKARAQALAVEKEDETSQKEFIEIIEFSLASEIYGIETAFIREVYPLKDFTTLPGIPSFVLGIVNVRGQIISVIDLKKFFNLPEKGLGELNKVIIIRNERMEFGILADIIHGTRSISLDSVQSLPVSTNEIGAEYLRGITNDHIIILDAVKILDDERIIIHQEAE